MNPSLIALLKERIEKTGEYIINHTEAGSLTRLQLKNTLALLQAELLRLKEKEGVSDEEIEREGYGYGIMGTFGNEYIPKKESFKVGAKWMRDKLSK